jgi:hypothetical protein
VLAAEPDGCCQVCCEGGKERRDERSRFRAMPSQVIRQYSYDPVSKTLFITFTSGELYAYLDVPPQTVEELKTASSRGRYFAYKIRNRYRYRRLEAGAA